MLQRHFLLELQVEVRNEGVGWYFTLKRRNLWCKHQANLYRQARKRVVSAEGLKVPCALPILFFCFILVPISVVAY